MLRSLPHLCKYMPEPKDARRQIPDPENEPDFYRISKLFPLPDSSDPVPPESIDKSNSPCLPKIKLPDNSDLRLPAAKIPRIIVAADRGLPIQHRALAGSPLADAAIMQSGTPAVDISQARALISPHNLLSSLQLQFQHGNHLLHHGLTGNNHSGGIDHQLSLSTLKIQFEKERERSGQHQQTILNSFGDQLNAAASNPILFCTDIQNSRTHSIFFK